MTTPRYDWEPRAQFDEGEFLMISGALIIRRGFFRAKYIAWNHDKSWYREGFLLGPILDEAAELLAGGE